VAACRPTKKKNLLSIAEHAHHPPPQSSTLKILDTPHTHTSPPQACVAALTWTLAHVWRPGDTLLFLRVVPDPPAPTACAFGGPSGPPALEAGLHLEAARSAIERRFAPLAQAAGAPFRVAIASAADPSCEAVGSLICERAAAVGAALVVLAAHNKSALAACLLGSTTRFCVAHCPVTVLVMRQGVCKGS
jgi:nucleotide-binding universal stress UspA family protein